MLHVQGRMVVRGAILYCGRCSRKSGRRVEPQQFIQAEPASGRPDRRPSAILHPVAAPLRVGLIQALGA